MESLSGYKETNPSENAINSFRKIGISLPLITFRDIYRITSRDTSNGSYPYNAGFSAWNKTRLDYALIKDEIEIGFYSINIGENSKTKKVVSETGMIHISPALRHKGLGTLVQFLSHMQELEKGAQEIRIREGDETGTIGRNNNNIGFIKIGRDFHDQPEWKLEFRDEKDRNIKLYELKSKFDEKISRLSNEDLLFDVNTVDRDNPRRIPIKQTIIERLIKLGWKFDDGERIIYGYAGADFVMYQQNFIDNSTRLNIHISKSSINNNGLFETCWKRVFGNEEPLIDPDSKYWKINSPKLYATDGVKKYAEKFSDFSQVFFPNILRY
ncbi:MAG: hypothetical protein Q8P29_03370 [Candidatus Levybacteria bacterium]|nr:hypothetical protein [Candidatus Levybacteria bacterium]